MGSHLLIAELGDGSLYRHNTFMNGVAFSAVIIVSFLLFQGTRELFVYKVEVQRLLDKDKQENDLIARRDEHNREVAKIIHDTNSNYIALQALSSNREQERLDSLLEKLVGSISEPDELMLCGNHYLEAILAHFAEAAKQQGIEMSFNLQRLPPLHIDDSDMGSLFGNLLRNAIEGCEKVSQGKRWISVTLKTQGSCLYCSIENSFAGAAKHSKGKYYTTKPDKRLHGIGTVTVNDIAKKYDGFSTFSHTDDSFSAKVVINIVSDNNNGV
jgi:signal transduction histidine kinase